MTSTGSGVRSTGSGVRSGVRRTGSGVKVTGSGVISTCSVKEVGVWKSISGSDLGGKGPMLKSIKVSAVLHVIPES